MSRLIVLPFLLFTLSASAQSFSEFSITSGIATVSSGASQAAAHTLLVKNVTRPANSLYLSYGAGASVFRLEYDITSNFFNAEQKLVAAHVPLGIGYITGEDQVVFTAGADLLPSYYFVNLDRNFSLGFSPNATIAFKLANGFRLGVIGRAIFMQSPLDVDNGFSTGYIGGGIVLHGL